MSQVLVRPAASVDIPALGPLGALLVTVHHGFDPRRFISPGPDTARGYGAFLASQLEEPDVVLLVAVEGEAVIGYAYASLEGPDWMSLRGPAGVIYDLVVDPQHRGGGVGRRLLEAARSELLARGAPRVVLSTAEPNVAARKLFAAAGFRPTMIEMTWDPPDDLRRDGG